jgi:hypothetical protein
VLHTFRRGDIACRLAGRAILCRNARAAVRVSRAGFAVVD